MTTDAWKRCSAEFDALASVIEHSLNILAPAGRSVPTHLSEGQTLARAILSSCVNTYEIYLTDLMVTIFLAQPNTLKSRAQLTVEEVLNCVDMAEVIQLAVDKRVAKLTRGSLDGFAVLFQETFGIDVFLPPESPRANELFEIRYLYTHRNGLVDARFRQKIPTSAIPVGVAHQMSVDDLLDAMNFLVTAVARVDAEAIRKYNL